MPHGMEWPPWWEEAASAAVSLPGRGRAGRNRWCQYVWPGRRSILFPASKITSGDSLEYFRAEVSCDNAVLPWGISYFGELMDGEDCNMDLD